MSVTKTPVSEVKPKGKQAVKKPPAKTKPSPKKQEEFNPNDYVNPQTGHRIVRL